MANLNKVMLIGIVGQDPTVRIYNEKKFGSFSLATSKKWTDKQDGSIKEDTQWHNIAVSGKIAEVTEKYVRKSSSVFVEGELRTRSYQANDGTTKYITEVQCEVLQLLDKRKQASAPVSAPASSPAQPAQPQTAYPAQAPIDDLPF